MKFWGIDIKQKNNGYFGVRRCTNCNQIRDVELMELQGKKCVCFFPVKDLGTKRFLICSHCTAALEINDDLWEYYSKYDYRFDKQTTDEIVDTLKNINNTLTSKEINLDFDSKDSQSALNLIYDKLCAKYNNPQNLEEIISVYFSK